MRFLIALFIFVFSFASSLHATEALEKTPQEGKEVFFSTTPLSSGTNHYWKDFVNMLLTLVFVLGLVFASVWFLKKFMRSRIRHLNRNTGIKILERRALTQKTSLYLVSILGKGVVISESAAGIHLVTELSPDVNVEELLAEKQEEAASTPSFAITLQKKMKQMMKREHADT